MSRVHSWEKEFLFQEETVQKDQWDDAKTLKVRSPDMQKSYGKLVSKQLRSQAAAVAIRPKSIACEEKPNRTACFRNLWQFVAIYGNSLQFMTYYIYIYIYTYDVYYIYILYTFAHTHTTDVYTNTHTHMHVYTVYICTYTYYIRIHTHTHTCMYIILYIYTLLTYINVYIYIWRAYAYRDHHHLRGVGGGPPNTGWTENLGS